MSELTIPSKDGKPFKAYVAMPETLPAPTIILIQEIFGVNAEMRKKCDDWASKGYIAVAPDLFWRLEPGVQLTDKTKEEWEKAFGYYKRFDMNKGVEDLRATVHTFRGHAESTGKVGVVGYCLGGFMAYLMACRSKVDCAVGYYGAGIDEKLSEAKNIKAPFMFHIAENDEYMPKDAQKKIHAALDGKSLIKLYDYPGVQHAFARGNGNHYDKNAATKADNLTFNFFEQHLKNKKAA